jgi:hypothetical protein
MNNHKFDVLVATVRQKTEDFIHELMKTGESDVNEYDRQHLEDAIYDLMAGLPNNYDDTSGIEDLEALADDMERT